MDAAQPPSPGTPHRSSDTLGVLRHRWWVVVLGTLLGLAAAGAWWQVQEPVWESSTSVLVHPVGRDINVVGGRTQGQVNLDTEAQLVRSTAVAAGAAGLLGTGIPADLARRVQVEVPPNTSVLVITFAGATPETARAGSQAFAQAYLQHREEAARAELAAQTKAIEAQVEDLTASLRRINDRLAGELPESSAAANLDSQRTTVTSQLTTLTSRLDELATATVTAGSVISEPRVPQRPSYPRPAILLASGAAVGLVLGIAGAGLAERLARRVHRPADISRRLGVPVLASLTPATAPRRSDIAAPYGPSGQAFDRLRNEVIALSGDAADPGTARVIVVTSPTVGAHASLTSANLAASLARSGREVVLVSARGPMDSGGRVIPPLLGVASAPGLAEVLAGRLLINEVAQRSLRHPRLQVVTTGATATAPGLLQSPAVRSMLAALAQRASHVVVDAPATSASADAQSLTSHADVTLLVVELRRTRLRDLADAVDQVQWVIGRQRAQRSVARSEPAGLQRDGAPVIGAVVTPPLRREPEDREPVLQRVEPEQGGPERGGPERGGPERGGPEATPPRARRTTGRPAPRPTNQNGQTIVLPRVLGGAEPAADPVPDSSVPDSGRLTAGAATLRPQAADGGPGDGTG